MKDLIAKDFPIGADGMGKVAASIDGSDLVASVQARIPMAKILDPIKKNFVDKLKDLIPGSWDDAIIDAAWNDAVKMLADGQVEAAPV